MTASPGSCELKEEFTKESPARGSEGSPLTPHPSPLTPHPSLALGLLLWQEGAGEAGGARHLREGGEGGEAAPRVVHQVLQAGVQRQRPALLVQLDEEICK